MKTSMLFAVLALAATSTTVLAAPPSDCFDRVVIANWKGGSGPSTVCRTHGNGPAGERCEVKSK